MHKGNAEIIKSYQDLFSQFGYSPKSLGWNKGKQFLRFHQLTADFNLGNSSILDVGCGFGDLVQYLNAIGIDEFEYVGVDFVEEFVAEARLRNVSEKSVFVHEDFKCFNPERTFDYVLASGTFNHFIEGVDKYSFLESNIKQMLKFCTGAVSFDLLSDKVDFSYDHNFNYCPLKVLEIAYGFSRNVVLKNNYFPFEFGITILKNDSFSKETTTFDLVGDNLSWLRA